MVLWAHLHISREPLPTTRRNAESPSRPKNAQGRPVCALPVALSSLRRRPRPFHPQVPDTVQVSLVLREGSPGHLSGHRPCPPAARSGALFLSVRPGSGRLPGTDMGRTCPLVRSFCSLKAVWGSQPTEQKAREFPCQPPSSIGPRAAFAVSNPGGHIITL